MGLLSLRSRFLLKFSFSLFCLNLFWFRLSFRLYFCWLLPRFWITLPKFYSFYSSILLCWVNFSILFEIVNHHFEEFIIRNTVRITYDHAEFLCSGYCNIHSSLILQKSNISSKVWSNHWDYYDLFFPSLKPVNCWDLNFWINLFIVVFKVFMNCFDLGIIGSYDSNLIGRNSWEKFSKKVNDHWSFSFVVLWSVFCVERLMHLTSTCIK